MGEIELKGLLAQFFEESKDLLCVVGRDGYFKRVNPAWELLLGRTQEEFTQVPFLELVHPDDLERTMAIYGNPDPERKRFDNRYRHKDGSYRWIGWTESMLDDEDGSFVRATDVTEEIENQERLKEARNLNDALLQLIPDMVFHLDREGTYLSSHVQADSRAVMPRENIVGTKLADSPLPEDVLERCMSALARTVDNHAIETVDYSLQLADGEGHFEARMIPGNNNDAFVVIRDMTDKKNFEAELIRAREEAVHFATEKSRFLANMSHEIRTPMNAVIGMNDLLLETELTPEQYELSSVVQRSGVGLLRVLDDILDFSKIEAGQMVIESIPFDLHKLVRDACLMFDVKAAERDITLKIEGADQVPQILLGDPGRITQTLLNLVSNAVKFTSHGVVTLRVGRENDGISFGVEDSGIGMSPDQTAALFTAFKQADSSTTRRFGGTGLGLTICRSLVELMGGDIQVTSTLHRGTTFYFTLPLAEPPLSRHTELPPPTVAPDTPRGALSLRVLVAEDNQINRTVALKQLQKLGCSARAVENGRVAVEALGEEDFDVVLMDCQMPELDGYAATEEIRSGSGSSRDIPIIALTAHALDGDRQKCLDAGMDDYVTKPIKRSELAAVMTKWVTQRKRAKAMAPLH